MEKGNDMVCVLSAMAVLCTVFISKYLILFLEIFHSHGDRNMFCYMMMKLFF